MQNGTCYILAMIKRDDGERLLLGAGYYEFTREQKHFNPNQFQNDIVELQGTDGQLLAGQVRRSTSQPFDGYIGDGTTPKDIVEQKRREFFLFFRKQHHYTVVYIMPDGSAIKRDRGYITDAPAVQELYQVQPKWHVALAFEDVNYYSYAEDDKGNEIYSFDAELGLANIEDGGLIFDTKGAISTGASYGIERVGQATGNPIEANITSKAAQFSNMELLGETSQDGTPTTTTITDKNLIHQLDAIASARLEHGTNTITATSENLGATMDADWIEFDPATQEGGYVWAPSSGGGPVIVTVNGVDSANPVWHVYGPATNPTLTNSSTGEAITWNNTVPANQELIIDMGNQTATLEGANVFEFVSGSWIQLKPGQNRISYTAANTIKSSRVYWNEVVG